MMIHNDQIYLGLLDGRVVVKTIDNFATLESFNHNPDFITALAVDDELLVFTTLKLASQGSTITLHGVTAAFNTKTPLELANHVQSCVIVPVELNYQTKKVVIVSEFQGTAALGFYCLHEQGLVKLFVKNSFWDNRIIRGMVVVEKSVYLFGTPTEAADKDAALSTIGRIEIDL